MLDSTWAYDYPAALRVGGGGRAVEEMDYHRYEDPLADQDIYNYVKLKQHLSIPILATEHPITGLDSYQPWIMLQATNYLRGDVAVKGGITTLGKAAHLADSFRMNYEVHHGGNSLNNVANLHVIASIRTARVLSRRCRPTARRNTAWSRTSWSVATAWCTSSTVRGWARPSTSS